jgi:hypothetical protein
MSSTSRLTHPTGAQDLAEQEVVGGRMRIHGSASFKGERVAVDGVTSAGLVQISGPSTLAGLPGFRDDPQVGIASGAVGFDALTRFWLVRTAQMDVVDERTPLPGLSTRIDDTEFGVTDTCGTVSLDGVRQLQLVWLGAEEPVGPDWVMDGYGCWTSLVDRAQVDDVRYVEWKAVWRDITVCVVDVRDSLAHIFVTSGGVPEFEAPEVRHPVSPKNCWSAVVPVAELSVRSWRSVEHPVGAGVVAGVVGFVRGRTTVLIRPAGNGGVGTGIVAIKNRGEPVTRDYVVHPMQADSSAPSVEWRASVAEADITDVRLISSTTVWKDAVTEVSGADEADDIVFVGRDSADREDTSPLITAAEPIGLVALPELELALVGLYADAG